MAALLRQLVKAGARLEEESDNAGTVLHFAASQNSASAVEALIALGADPNARGPDGITPLETALRYHHADAALALLTYVTQPCLRTHLDTHTSTCSAHTNRHTHAHTRTQTHDTRAIQH